MLVYFLSSFVFSIFSFAEILQIKYKHKNYSNISLFYPPLDGV